MFEKLVTSLEPFAYGIIILSGASMAGYASFTNDHLVGVVTVFFGILLAVKHVVSQIQPKKPKASKKEK